MRLLLAFFLSLIPLHAHAFPEMIRHHYVNCNACHVNPNGGGLLTEYGRGMASEVLSTWSYENESLFLHGLVKPGKIPSFLNIGGDVRAVQVHSATQKATDGRYILMQTSLESAVTAGLVTAVAAFGEPDRQNNVLGNFTSFYLLGNLSETLQLKVGRFLPTFGIHDPHHTLSTRQALGFGYGDRNAAELHYSGEQWHIAVGASRSRVESALRQEEKAGMFQLEKFFSDSNRIGFSVWAGESELQKRTLFSLHGLFGFTEKLYLLSETAFQHKKALTGKSSSWNTGIFHFARFGFEIEKGLHLIAFEDNSKSNLNAPNSFIQQFGGGAVWYPRPHFEFELTYSRKRTLVESMSFGDYAYLMLHYYL